MSPGFSARQLKKLATQLDPTRVHTRQQEGKTLSYIEGWFVLSEANRIFGYDGWDREMVHFERAFERKTNDGTSCGYLARVRVRVRASATTIVREGTGFGQASATKTGDAHERALKAAETDATKRALATFGSRFGLMLYDKEHRPAAGMPRSQSVGLKSSAEASGSAGARGADDIVEPVASKESIVRYRLIASDGSVTELRSPESFCSGLRQLLDAARDQDEVLRLQHNNAATITALRDLSDLRTQRGEHYADILERLIAQRIAELAAKDAPAPDTIAEPAAGTDDAYAFDIGAAEAVKASVTSEAELGDLGETEGAPSVGKRTYGSFVPVPDYPLAGLKERVVRPGRAAGSGPRSPEVRKGVSKEVGTVRIKTELLPTRRSQITGGFSIDKSALLVPSERRLRSKAHLQFVASKPCVICEALPCHAHHITFAQARGLSQKVSDEFTVPLCAQHHNELHVFGNEASWWRAQGIEPLAKASALWNDSVLGRDEGASGLG